MSTEHTAGKGTYVLECRQPDGTLRWAETIDNTVVNVGLQDMNTKYFKGASYTAAWYLGLIQGPGSGVTIAAGDTLATHAGWTESTAYSGSRPAVTFGTATTANPSVIDNTASPSVFNINGTATIAGAFLCNAASGTSGILFSAAKAQSPGDRAVYSGDILTVTYSFSYTAT